MAKQNFCVARAETRTRASVGKFERHIERKNESCSLDFRLNHIYNYDKHMKVMEIVPSVCKASGENSLRKLSGSGTIQC